MGCNFRFSVQPFDFTGYSYKTMDPKMLARSADRLKKLLVAAAVVAVTGCVGSGGSGGGGDTAGGTDTGGNQTDERPSATVPDMDSFSMSFESLSLDGALGSDGVTNEVTVRLSDNLNNTVVPDGTRVRFTTNSGAIDPFCETVDGACSVTWISQGARPGVGPSADNPGTNPRDPGCGTVRVSVTPSCPRPNRVKVLAWVEGQETFTDLNANGFFDDGDSFVTAGPNPDDRPDPFRDDNENGVRDSDEVFVEYPCGISTQCGSSAQYNPADGLYSGPDCAHSTLCSSQQRLFIADTGVFALPSDSYVVEVTDCAGAIASEPLTPGAGEYCWIAYDSFGNPLPSGTSVSYNANALDSVIGTNAYGSSNQVADGSFNLIADDTPDTGVVQITFTSPGGASHTALFDTQD